MDPAKSFEFSVKPVLFIACGNPSRGDDALGLEFLQCLEGRDLGCQKRVQYDTVSDYQLQIEHALDLVGRELVLFVDASFSAKAPYEFSQLTLGRDLDCSTHIFTPCSVLSVYSKIASTPAPSAFSLTISGYRFELGEPISDLANKNLRQACDFISDFFCMHECP